MIFFYIFLLIGPLPYLTLEMAISSFKIQQHKLTAMDNVDGFKTLSQIFSSFENACQGPIFMSISYSTISIINRVYELSTSSCTNFDGWSFGEFVFFTSICVLIDVFKVTYICITLDKCYDKYKETISNIR